MANIVKSFEKYIYEDIGISVSPCDHIEATSLPYFILNEYDLYRTHILHYNIFLLLSKKDQEVSPATIRKNIEIVKKGGYENVVFVHPSISSHNRKRLVEYKVPFVVPGNQMYLPDLMIDLRDHFYSLRSNKTKFSPSTQAVILYVLHNYRAQPFTPSVLAKKIDYASMTMTRSFDEIEAAELGRIDVEGRERWLWIQEERRQFWQKALPYLNTPVRRQVWIRELPDELRRFEDGETALSRYTMISPAKQLTFAVEKKEWEYYKRRDAIEVLKTKEDADFRLQIWNYHPKLFAEGKTVDKFSLYLSLKDSNDERIQGALEDMMESIQW